MIMSKKKELFKAVMFVNNWPRTWIWTHSIKIKLALHTVFEYFVENLIFIYLKKYGHLCHASIMSYIK